MNIDKIKVFGERHTATNAVQEMLRQSFHLNPLDYSQLGWKHRMAPQKLEWQKYDIEKTLILVTVRNPYTWMCAMHRNPYNGHQPNLRELSFEDFLLHPIEDYENPICLWNEKNRSYIRLASEVPHAIISRIEDFSLDQAALFSRVEVIGGLKGKFSPFEKYVDGIRVHNENPAEKLRNQVLRLPNLSPPTYALINKFLDRSVMDVFEYPVAGGYDESPSAVAEKHNS